LRTSFAILKILRGLRLFAVSLTFLQWSQIFDLENISQHFELVKQKLNATDPNAFAPSLTNLDALIQSITASPP
jgi:hypothetical protein